MNFPVLGWTQLGIPGTLFAEKLGATFAFQCGASPAQIKEPEGDWKSSAYLLYLEFDDPARARVAALMAHSILLTTLAVPRSSSPLASPPGLKIQDSIKTQDSRSPVVDLVVILTRSLEGRLVRRIVSGGMKPMYHHPPLLNM
jgi:hypothetical protein